jgi:hypothetical protein
MFHFTAHTVVRTLATAETPATTQTLKTAGPSPTARAPATARASVTLRAPAAAGKKQPPDANDIRSVSKAGRPEPCKRLRSQGFDSARLGIDFWAP